jgi:hypothetical protein
MCRLHLALGMTLALLTPLAARADYHIRSPYEIDLGEIEIEHNGASSFDHVPAKNRAQSETIEIGTGITSRWHTEIEIGFNRDPGGQHSTLLEALVWENMIQITEPGEYFADWGFYAEYAQSMLKKPHAGPNSVTFGPVIGKDIGQTTSIVNLLFTRQLGPNQDTSGLDFSYAWQTRWNLWEPLSPAIEIYGDAGVLGRAPRFAQQQLLIGPVAIGALKLRDLGLGRAGKLKYEMGWLFGATHDSPQGVLRWRVELEIPF